MDSFTPVIQIFQKIVCKCHDVSTTPMVFLHLIWLLIWAGYSIMWGGKYILKEHLRTCYGRREWKCQRWEEIMVLVYSVFLFRNILNACFIPFVSNGLPRIKLSLKKYWLTDLLFCSVFNESTLVCLLFGWVFFSWGLVFLISCLGGHCMFTGHMVWV